MKLWYLLIECDNSCLIFLAGVPVPSGQHSSLIASPQQFSPSEFPLYITQIYSIAQVQQLE